MKLYYNNVTKQLWIPLTIESANAARIEIQKGLATAFKNIKVDWQDKLATITDNNYIMETTIDRFNGERFCSQYAKFLVLSCSQDAEEDMILRNITDSQLTALKSFIESDEIYKLTHTTLNNTTLSTLLPIYFSIPSPAPIAQNSVEYHLTSIEKQCEPFDLRADDITQNLQNQIVALEKSFQIRAKEVQETKRQALEQEQVYKAQCAKAQDIKAQIDALEAEYAASVEVTAQTKAQALELEKEYQTKVKDFSPILTIKAEPIIVQTEVTKECVTSVEKTYVDSETQTDAAENQLINKCILDAYIMIKEVRAALGDSSVDDLGVYDLV